MSDDRKWHGVVRACSLTLLMVAGAAAAGDDLRLVEAARNKDVQQAAALLKGNPNVNVRSPDGSTALLWASHWNDVPTAELLLRAGADANAANDLRMTPLSRACTNGSSALVGLLLKAGAQPNTPIGTGETPLMTCAHTGNIEAVRMLLAHGVDVNAKEPIQNQTALMWAAAEQHASVVKALIEAHADVKAHTKTGFTALHFAAREGDLESARALLDAGVDVNVRALPERTAGRGAVMTGAVTGRAGGQEAGGGRAGAPRGGGPARSGTAFVGATPLLVATVRGELALAHFLLDRGADPNVLDGGFTPLFWASGTWENGLSNPVYGFVDPVGGIQDRREKLRLVNALLAHGANPNLQMRMRPPTFRGTGSGGFNDAAGATAFIVAANAADVEIMRILLAAGADPKVVTNSGSNALLAATALTRGIGEFVDDEDHALEAIKFLLDLGLDPKSVTKFNENALFGPAYRGWNRVMELLIEKGAEVNIVNKGGVTPYLASSGLGDRIGGVLFNTEGAALLLKHGADPKLGRPCQAQNRCRPE
jgi:ankyrin repeat protein